MFSTTIKFITRCTNPATPVREGLLHVSNDLRKKSYSSVLTLSQYNLKQSYLSNIKIYRTGVIKDPVHDYETLKLFDELEAHINNKDKAKAIECINRFVQNDNGIYNADYGKAKQQLGDILYSHRKTFKITPLEVLEKMGFEKNELIKMGILETTLLKTKSCVSSTVFEILVMDTLPNKYSVIQKVYYCQDGAVKIKCINLTGQINYDYVIEFKDEKGQLTRIAFDSKVQKLDTCLDNLRARGLKYQILTVGNIPDVEIQKTTSFNSAVSRFKDKNYKTKMNKVEIVLDVENQNEEPEDIMSSSIVATMFVNTDDINLSRQKVLARKNNMSSVNINEQHQDEVD